MDNRVKAAFSYVFGWITGIIFWPLKKRMNLYGKARRSPLCWAFFCWRATFWCSGFPLRGRCCPAVLASAASCCGSSSSWKRFKTFIFACRSSVRFLKIMWCGGFCKNDCSGFLKSNRRTSGKRLFLKHLSETASFHKPIDPWIGRNPFYPPNYYLTLQLSSMLKSLKAVKEKVSEKWLPEGKTELPFVLGFRKK